jgi:hypothetical protein
VKFGGGARSWIRRYLELSISGLAAARSLPGRNTTLELQREAAHLSHPPRAEPSLYNARSNVGDYAVYTASNGLPPTFHGRLLHTTEQKLGPHVPGDGAAALETAAVTLALILKQGIPQLPGPSLTGPPVPSDLAGSLPSPARARRRCWKER